MKFINLIKSKNAQIQKNIKLPNIDGFFNSYIVSIEDLLFNPYNNRFAKEILAHENEHNIKVGFNKKSQQFLLSLLSNISRNKSTKKDIIKNGLMRYIVVDLAGVIIDGNRRVSIVREILQANNEELEKRFSNLEVVIIPRELNEKEIKEYETKLQISEDQKLEYDVINMHLKVDGHLKEFAHLSAKEKYQKVASLLGAKFTYKKIEQMEKTFLEMGIYLREYIKKPFAYHLLDGKDDQFKQLTILSDAFKLKSGNKKINIDYPNTYPNFVRLKRVLYSFIALGLRANPYFRDLVPKNNPIKSPLSRLEGLKKTEEFLKNNNLNNFIPTYANELHKHFKPDDLIKFLENLNNNLNSKTPQLKHASKIVRIEDESKNLYQAMRKGELKSLSEEKRNKLINAKKYLEKILEEE